MLTLINFTNSAEKKIEKLFLRKKNKNLKFRVYIIGGGCNGFQYGFSFDEKVNDDDHIVKHNSISLIIDSISLQYLSGGFIDYKEELEGSRFLVINPNAKHTCSCGLSFSI